MKTILKKMRDLFCYCGATKEQYRSIKKDAYVANFVLWRYLNILMVILFAVEMALGFIRSVSTVAIIFRIAALAYSVIISVMFFTILREDSLIAQLVIYLSMIIVLLYSLFLSLDQPSSIAVAFIALLIILPMCMVDKPYFMALVITLAVIIYLFSVKTVKTPEAFQGDLVNTIIIGILGILANMMINAVRVREFLAKKSHEDLMEQQRADHEETIKLNNTLAKMSEGVVELLGDVVESRDEESGEHIQRVKGFTYILASQIMEDLPEYGLDQYKVNLITFTSALHDVGKISIPDAVLLKPGKLTDEEFEIMKTHCVKGVEIIKKMAGSWDAEYLDMGLSICLNHHEKWDGKGYPNGLKGDEIPIEAQIVSIADIIDALTTKRVYKDAYSFEEAFRMIENGECGAFSDKILACLDRCKEKFKNYAEEPTALEMAERQYEITKTNKGGVESFVVGLHDDQKTMQEKNRLREELSVISSLGDDFAYICYVDMIRNEVYRFKAGKQFERILDSMPEGMPSNEKFDKLLNSIIVAEDYVGFRKATNRDADMEQLHLMGHLSTDFRIRLDDGVHYCRLKIALIPGNDDAVVIGIALRDEEHEKEAEYIKMQSELEAARLDIENREKMADRMAVISTIGDEYDYICTLNADSMEVTVYKAVDWIRDMFKNLEDIVVSPAAREQLEGIIYPEDFARFKEQSLHKNVVKALMEKGTYSVNYRAYKYGKLVHYQTRYALDKNDSKRLIVGLRCLNDRMREDANVE